MSSTPLNNSSKALFDRVAFISVKVWFNSANKLEVRLIAARLNLFPRNMFSASSLIDCRVLFNSRTVSIGTPLDSRVSRLLIMELISSKMFSGITRLASIIARDLSSLSTSPT